MWKSKLIRNSLLLLVLHFVCVLPLFAQADSSDIGQSNTQQNKELTTSNLNLNESNQKEMNFLSNAQNSKNKLEQQNPKSMTASELLDNLDLQITSLQMQLEQREHLSQNLETELKTMKQELQNSKNTCRELKKALNSSNIDLDNVIGEIGKLSEDVKYLEEKLRVKNNTVNRLRTTSYVELGIGVSSLVVGLLPIWTDDQKNLQNIFLGVGGAMTVSGGITFTLTLF